MLQGKIALVTGGTRGIGYAIVKKFLEHGATVILCGSREETAKRAEQQLKAENADWHVEGIWPDLTDPAQLQAACSDIQVRHGRLDILVNNAGYNVGGNKRKPITEYDEADVRMVTNICLDGMYHCCRFVLPYMKQAGGGKIVNTGSVTGFHAPLKWQAPYNAAKAAVHNITRTMAAAYGKYHINVNAVIPGSVMNEGLKGMVYDTDDKARSMIEHIPLGRTGRPDDIANAVCFLCSPYADYITGCLLNVDGGWAAAYSAE